MRCRLRIVAALCSAAVASACGSTPAPPTSPDPPLVVVSSIAVNGESPRTGQARQFSAIATYSNGTTGDITATAVWSSSVPAVATVVAGLVTGLSSGVTEIRASSGSATALRTVTVAAPPGTAPSAFMRDYIEALFFGTGALAATDIRGCPFGGAFVGFAAGTRIDIAVSSAVPASAAAALAAAAPAISTASAGSVSAALSTTASDNPFPTAGQITVAMNAHPEANPGCFPQGCTFVFPGPLPFIGSARAILQTGQTNNAYVHDAIGHGALGLCHVNGALIGGPGLSLMSYGPGIFSDQIADRLTDFDLQAAAAVYSSGLARGATRADFLRAGLVNPSNASSPAQAVPAGGPIAAPPIRR